MTTNPTAVVGAFFLERTYRTAPLRVYNVFEGNHTTDAVVALLWVTNAPRFGIPQEWRIECQLCQPPPSTARQEKQASVFATRDRALLWLSRHRTGKHR